jgi:hypothetical protein
MLSEEAQYAEEGLLCRSLIVRFHNVWYFVSSSVLPKPARMLLQGGIFQSISVVQGSLKKNTWFGWFSPVHNDWCASDTVN